MYLWVCVRAGCVFMGVCEGWVCVRGGCVPVQCLITGSLQEFYNSYKNVRFSSRSLWLLKSYEIFI